MEIKSIGIHKCAWKSEEARSSDEGKKGLTTVVGGVGVAERLWATFEEAADRNGCSGDGEYGKRFFPFFKFFLRNEPNPNLFIRFDPFKSHQFGWCNS
jgi:hypothetical protein